MKTMGPTDTADGDVPVPQNRHGMWGWILLIVSAAFAMPNSLSDAEAPLMGDDRPTRIFDLLYPLKWMNPLRWIPVFSVFRSNSGPPVPASATMYLDPIELAHYFGYTAERHAVTTEDGYIMELHRLPSGRKNISSNNEDELTPRPVVFLHHAFLTSSREYLLLGPQKALAFVLSDAGFDVWLANARGNTFSRNHTSLKPEQKEFWEWSYQEHGTHDLPAAINYILKESGRSQLHYIGHSMGTTAFLIMASEKPEMLSKIKTFSAMAPVTSTMNCRSRTLRLFMTSVRLGVTLLERLGMYEFMPHYRWVTLAGQTICHWSGVTQPICTGLLSTLSGKSTSMDPNIIPEMLTHTPAGTSLKTLNHFAQNHHSGFRKFDYGVKGNKAHYDTDTPPTYNIKSLNVPTQIFYGMNDLMADFTEAEYVCKTVPNAFKCEKVPDDTWTHLDFIWSEKAHILLYPSILDGIKKYEDFRAD